jgi:hypothetical protein
MPKRSAIFGLTSRILGPGLIEKDQAARIEFRFYLLPAAAPFGDIGTGLFGRDQGLF